MARKTIHLVNPLWDATGGSEWRTLNLYSELSPHCDVFLWSEQKPDPTLASKYDIRRIDLAAGNFPQGGTIVIVGAYFPVGPWMESARPDRLILVYNTPTPKLFMLALYRLGPRAPKWLELVYTSEALRAQVGLPGRVETSLLDIGKFSPVEPPEGDRFAVGRLSRGVSLKHHPADLPLYRDLVGHGCQVRIMGPDPKWPAEPGEGITVLPAGSCEAHLFLQSLDCFFYRTSTDWVEPWGRVVSEAMACGLPVVCHRSGGYRNIIKQGENGFLFDKTEEAMSYVLELKRNVELRRRVGRNARKTAEELLSGEARAKIVEYYLR